MIPAKIRFLHVITLCVLLSGIGIGQDHRIHRGLVFALRGERKLKLDLYVPRQEGKGLRPAVMVIHGGGWVRGGPRNRAARFFATRLVREGYVVASISYRHAPAHPWPAQIADCSEAIQWLRHHASEYQLDPNRVGAIGASAGGHLAALLGTVADAASPRAKALVRRHSTRPQCVVAYSSPMVFDLTEDASVTGRRLVTTFLVGLRNPDDAKVRALLHKRAREASPLHHLSKSSAPLLMVHGTGDPLVPLKQAQRMATAMKARGLTHELIPVRSKGHLWYLYGARGESRPAWWKRTTAFLDKHLSLKTQAAK